VTRGASRPRDPAGHLSPPEQALVTYVLRHGMVSPLQLARRLSPPAQDPAPVLRPLQAAGLVSVDSVFVGGPAVVRATRLGARTAACDVAPATLDLARVRHNLALVDLSEELLAAHPGSTWTTERELRRDRVREARARGRWEPQRRIPDGLLRLPDGRRVAIELDLTAKRTVRLDLLAGAYAVDAEVDIVWWYLPSERNVARMRGVVADRGLEDLIEPRLRRVAPIGG
jgi:hypothetical protein